MSWLSRQELRRQRFQAEADKRPAFGNRHLTDPDQVFQHNAWDNVEWTEEMEREALEKVQANSKTRITGPDAEKLEDDAAVNWDKFYGVHEEKFFKDRQWLLTEFPELKPEVTVERGEEEGSFSGVGKKFRVLEVGCGVGNTLFPILASLSDEDAYVYGCDFSEKAISLVRNHPSYSADRCHAFVHDITRPDVAMPFPKSSLDVIVMIFVLSAVHPRHFQDVMNGLAEYLRPGGRLVIRDYGRYDMAQMRFKDGRCLVDNFYKRGDDTFVYYFKMDELCRLCAGAGLKEIARYEDRRLQVNRGKQLKMYRVWVQCRFEKPKK